MKTGGRDRLVRATRTRGGGFAVAPAGESLAEPGDRRLRGPRVVTLVTHLSARHERLRMPSMSRRRLEKAISHRLDSVREHDSGQEASCAPYDPRNPGDLLLVTVGRRAVRECIDAVERDGHRVDRLTTPMAAIIGLLRASGTLDTDEGASVIVHLGESMGSVGFVQGGALLLARAFPMPRTDPDDDVRLTAIDPTDHEILISEIGRSLLFFNHELHGIPVGRILISSDLTGLEAIVPSCHERFRVPVSPTIERAGLDLVAFADAIAPSGETPGVWLGAIAAAVTGLTGRPDIDLLPVSFREQRARRRLIRASAAGFVLAAAAMSVVNVGQMRAYRTATEHLIEGRVRLDEMNELLHELREERAERHAARERVEFMSRTAAPMRAFGEALNALSVSAEGGVQIDHLDMAPVADMDTDPYADASATSGAWTQDAEPAKSLTIRVDGGRTPARTLHVTGRVWGEDAAAAERLFEQFYGRLRARSALREASLDPIAIRLDEETGRSVLSFVIHAPIRG